MKTLLRSFAGGEITPELFGRVDLAKYQTGLELAKNFLILPFGSAQNRPGFRYVFPAGATTSDQEIRLIPFSFSTEQTYVLEFGPQYVRFHTQGGTLLETSVKSISNITQAASALVTTTTAHGYTYGDVVFIYGVNGMTEVNNRYFKITPYSATAFFLLDPMTGLSVDSRNYGAYTGGGSVTRVYTLATPYLNGQLAGLKYTQSADVLTLAHPSHPLKVLKRLGPVNWALSDVTFAPGIAPPAGPPTISTGGPGGGTPVSEVYCATAVQDKTGEESVISASAGAFIDLNVSGNFVDITPAASPGPNVVRYNVYKLKNGLFGFIGQVSAAPGTLRDRNIAPDMSRTPPNSYNPFSSSPPSAVGYVPGRKVFAASNAAPQTVLLSRSATEHNLSYSIPTRDDDSIEFTLNANQVNRIRHVLNLSDLLLLTSGGAWRVKPGDAKGVLTPSNVYPIFLSSEGTADVMPVQVSNNVLYVNEGMNRVIELRYNEAAGGLGTNNISVLVPHLFEQRQIVDSAYTAVPYPMAWFLRDDGVLLGLTYVPEQEVYAWHRHVIAGKYGTTEPTIESIAAVREAYRDVLYAVTRRVSEAGVRIYSIEYLTDRDIATQADGVFLDHSLSYAGPPVTTLVGLWHLEGRSVDIVADGGALPQQTVTNGRITLPYAASKVHVGFRYDCDLKTVPLFVESLEAGGLGSLKSISQAFLRVSRTTGLSVGPTFDMLRDIPPRTNEPYGSPPGLRSGELRVAVTGLWNDTGQLCVRQRSPVPCSILALILEAAAEGS